MEQHLLALFQSMYEKQDVLSKLTDQKLYSQMTPSEVHCLAAINTIVDANVTDLATHLHMTCGAVSKITKKLTSKKLIESFQKPGNKKEKYFRLTEQGKQVDAQHTKAHAAWLKRDTKFLETISSGDKAVIKNFLEKFNSYLEATIEEKIK